MTKRNLFKNAVSLLREGNNITQTAEKLNVSKETISQIFRHYRSRLRVNFLLNKHNRIFKLSEKEIEIPQDEVNLDGTLWMKNKEFSISLYKYFLKQYTNNKYLYINGFLVSDNIKLKLLRKCINGDITPLSDLKYAVKPFLSNRELKLISELYQDEIFLWNGYVVVAQVTPFYKIVEKLAMILHQKNTDNISIEMIYDILKQTQYGKKVLKSNKIDSLEVFNTKLKSHALNSKYFLKMDGGIWHIKSNIADQIDDKKTQLIVSTVRDIVKSYYNPFNIDVLLCDIEQKIKGKDSINIDKQLLKTILLESKEYDHYKSLLILKVESKQFFTIYDIVKDILESNDFLSIEDIIKEARKKGRAISSDSVRNTLTKMENVIKSGEVLKNDRNRSIKLYTVKKKDKR